MKEVPNWEWLMVIYFIMVAVPVMLVHVKMRRKLHADKSPRNFLLYVLFVVGTAFLMHFITMWIYFRVLFVENNQ